jgi:hypothetical protein
MTLVLIIIYFLTVTRSFAPTGCLVIRHAAVECSSASPPEFAALNADILFRILDKCVWIEISTLDSINLLIGNHYYFSLDAKTEVLTNYFHFLEDKLDTINFRVVMMGDFNTPGFDWYRGLSVPDCHYYSKLRGHAIYTSTCLLILPRRNSVDLTWFSLTSVTALSLILTQES